MPSRHGVVISRRTKLFAAATAAVMLAALPQSAAAHAAAAQPVDQAAAGDPAITVDPAALDSVQQPDQRVTRELTIGNTGDAELRWQVFGETGEQFRLPIRPTTPVRALPAEPGGSGDFHSFPGFGGRPGWTVQPDFPSVPADQLTLSHSPEQAIIAGDSVACGTNRGVRTSATGYLRHFTPSDFGIVGDLHVESVSFGVESLRGSAQQVTVNLYLLGDPQQEFRYENFELLGTADVTVTNQTMSVVQVPVSGTVPVGSTLVVEVAAPDMRSAGFYLASHPGSQTAESYLRATGCGVPEPASTTDLGLDAQWLINVNGGATLLACDAPAGTPWLQIEPTAGTVAPDGRQTVEITFDSTGLGNGDIRATDLCLASNDPARPRLEIPLRLEVRQFPAIEVTPEALHAEQRPDEVSQQILTIANPGDAGLSWQIETAVAGCDQPESVPWLAAAPAQGETGSGEQTVVTVSFDSTGLTETDLAAILCVASDDPDRPVVEVPVTLAVRGPACDQVITGVHPGPLTVTEGVTCLEPGSRVEGVVNVLDRAGLVADATVVQGALSTFGATVVELSASQVVGPISIRGTSGSVVMTDTQVVGSVLVVANQPADGPPLVAGNWIVGSLFCTGNQPPPVDGGTPNTIVGGMKLDQCAGL